MRLHDMALPWSFHGISWTLTMPDGFHGASMVLSWCFNVGECTFMVVYAVSRCLHGEFMDFQGLPWRFHGASMDFNETPTVLCWGLRRFYVLFEDPPGAFMTAVFGFTGL